MGNYLYRGGNSCRRILAGVSRHIVKMGICPCVDSHSDPDMAHDLSDDAQGGLQERERCGSPAEGNCSDLHH